MDNTLFYEEVINGLKKNPKELNSKYFYDDEGDKIFQEIMNLPEYYLTDCEFDIIKNQGGNILQSLGDKKYDIVEMGAGDGAKSILLLEKLREKQDSLNYYPIDISADGISKLKKKINKDHPQIKFKGLAGEYFSMMSLLKNFSTNSRLILFLGSSIGNFPKANAAQFLKALKSYCQPNDLLLIGFDLVKDPEVILEAYNDRNGVTKSFNLNLLTRINRELSGNFLIENFQHEPNYNPDTGACKSFLTSTKDQEVRIGENKISFQKDEKIFMEISQKFTVNEIDELAIAAGFKKIQNFFDEKKWFLDALWKAT